MTANIRYAPYAAPWNIAGLPAIVVPVGLRPDGLPVAVQLVGPPGSELLLLGVAGQFEMAAPWHAPRPRLSPGRHGVAGHRADASTRVRAVGHVRCRRRAARGGGWHDRGMTELVSLDDVRGRPGAARRRHPHHPAGALPAAQRDARRADWLKCENLQRAGSYKVRGAYVRISRLSAAERARGVVAASAGNHAQGVALAAGLLGTHATVFMPVGAPLPKVAATKGYGAQVELAGNTVDEALVAAQDVRRAHRRGADPPVRPPGRDRRAGHGGAGDPRTVPGGQDDHHRDRRRRADLRAWRWRRRRCARTSGSSACRRPGRPRSRPRWRPGEPVRLPGFATIADGIAVGRPGDLTFAHVTQAGRRGRHGHRGGHLPGPADAAGAGQAGGRAGRGGRRGRAAGRRGRGGDAGGGGALRRQHRPVADAAGDRARAGRGRVATCGSPSAARTGRASSPSLLSQIAEHRANVVDVAHQRARPAAAASARSRWRCRWRPGASEHSDPLISALRASGYQVVFAAEA